MTRLHFSPTQTNAINPQKDKRSETGYFKEKQQRFYGIWKSVWDLAFMFGKRTTIHGLNRLLGETAGLYERLIWFLTIILALTGSIYVCLLLSRRFNEGKFQTVVDNTRFPVYKIHFPVISICNLNRLNWHRIDEAKKRFMPNETSTEKLRLFERIVGAYDDIRFANFQEFSVLEGEPLDSMNHINFSLVIDFMTWRCDELLENCVWRHTEMDCCKIFSKRRTKSGPCWAFNSLESEEGRLMQRMDPMWPWRVGGAGPTSALQLRVLLNPEKHFPNRTNKKGLSIMVTEPYVWHKDHIFVGENTLTTLEIEPVIYYYDNNTRGISSDQRQCVFENERSSSDFKSLENYVYMIENCQSECHQEYLVQNCNCTVDLLFPPGQYTSCKVKDLLCLARNNENFLYSHQPGEELFVRPRKNGMKCKCYRNCYSLNYVSDVSASYLPPDVRHNVSYVDLDAFFRFETLMVYRTSLVFTWIDLMVAFGGIAGLFLGCSLISVMELAYFAIIEIPNFVAQRTNCRRKKFPTQSSEINNAPQREQQIFQHRFGDFARRNLPHGHNQFEKIVTKFTAVKPISVQAPIYTHSQATEFLKWQQSVGNNDVKIFKNKNFIYD